MARTARLILPGQLHHIIQRGNNRQAIFRDDADYRSFLNWLREAARMFNISIHAYVLMSNHIHLLATPADDTGLARMMQWLGRHYVPYFNRKYGRTGTLWEGRFRTSIVDSESYFMACSLYIEMNPVRSGLVSDASAYAWSSFAHHAGLKSDSLITDHPLYWALGNTPFAREAAYRELSGQGLAMADVLNLNKSLLKGHPLGTEQFLMALEKKTSRRVRPGKRGRPSKVQQRSGNEADIAVN